MKRLSLTLLILLAACGTPQEQCIARNTRDLRTVENLIREAEGNLARGYAFRTETEFETVYAPCTEPQPPVMEPHDPDKPVEPRLCPRLEPVETRVPVAIDLEAEARKLAQLRDKRASLQKAAQGVIAQCQAEYPE